MNRKMYMLGSVVQRLDEMSGTRRSVYIVYFLAPAVLVISHLDQNSYFKEQGTGAQCYAVEDNNVFCSTLPKS